MSFADPGFLYLLLLVPGIIAYYIFRQRKSNPTLSVAGNEQFGEAPRSFRHWLRHVIFGARVTAVLLLIIALARPQKNESYQDTSTEGIDIVLALDISGSMLARDFKPDRLEASKNVATEFISGRPYDRIGLVVFSGESFTQCPVTSDHAVLINMLREMKSGMIEDGTAIGEGLATAVNRIKDSKSKSKVIILLTDGVNNRGIVAPLTAAEIAKTYGVRVYTIGVGTRGVADMPVQTPSGVRMQQMEVEIDEGILTEIAKMTDGKYFRATDNEKLVQVYNDIDKLEKSRIEVRQFKVKEERFLTAAVIALALFIFEIISRVLLMKNLA
ncbi:MAG: VWA domain-containing protein [Bacteroidales bacterium]